MTKTSVAQLTVTAAWLIFAISCIVLLNNTLLDVLLIVANLPVGLALSAWVMSSRKF
jgi:hypothetical protein